MQAYNIHNLKQLDIVVDNRFRLVSHLGGGSFGQVYQALDLQTNTMVALKLEPHSQHDSLDHERRILKHLGEGKGFPKLLYYNGHIDDYRVLAMDLLGPGLVDLRRYCGGPLSLKTVLMLADQLLRRLKHIHSKGIVHQDIKPSNILMGSGRSGNVVYLADMGLSKIHAPLPGNPLDNPAKRPRLQIFGTEKYCAQALHRQRYLAFRDDLESLGYVLLDLLLGRLPWSDEKDGTLTAHKLGIDIPTLCAGAPPAFQKLFEEVKRVRYNEMPNYNRLRKLFNTAFRQAGYKYDNVYDWTIKRYAEMEVAN
ncbi:kinase-like protein [Aspergillus ellipticus CBS 707.79]|uniref:non-specific serine/threonine protein kinase n=1 Tax=Aspergillus ellipticus CBS 707.79 TaxID=1448320 RepID=A0A319DXH4_9EURO|nr:kinase-like protein [Aspergillus ellipticus CBS 707.79]